MYETPLVVPPLPNVVLLINVEGLRRETRVESDRTPVVRPWTVVPLPADPSRLIYSERVNLETRRGPYL